MISSTIVLGKVKVGNFEEDWEFFWVVKEESSPTRKDSFIARKDNFIGRNDSCDKDIRPIKKATVTNCFSTERHSSF